MYTHTRTHTHARTHTHTYVCLHTYAYTRMSTHICLHTYAYTHVHTRVYTHMPTHMSTRMSTHMSAHMDSRAHRSALMWEWRLCLLNGCRPPKAGRCSRTSVISSTPSALLGHADSKQRPEGHLKAPWAETIPRRLGPRRSQGALSQDDPNRLPLRSLLAFAVGMLRKKSSKNKSRARVYSRGPRLREQFRKFDLDKNGSVDYDELRIGMKAMNLGLTEEEMMSVATVWPLGPIDPSTHRSIHPCIYASIDPCMPP